MKKTFSFILIFSLLVLTLSGCSNKNANSPADNTTTPERVSTNISIENTANENNTLINEIRIGAHEADLNNEQELATFSTKLGGKDTPRSRNISITTSTLNETIIKNGETFSFCEIVRKSHS